MGAWSKDARGGAVPQYPEPRLSSQALEEENPTDGDHGGGAPVGAPDSAHRALPITSPPAAGRLLVHLVHGTWPDGLWQALRRGLVPNSPYPAVDGTQSWFQSAHVFRTTLEQRLRDNGITADVRPFIWSGFNSFRARARAAEELLPHLARGVVRSDRQLIIGHSHGGTVAMLALKMMAEGATAGSHEHGGSRYWLPASRQSSRESTVAVQDQAQVPVETVQAAAADVELVTMATPFLRVERFGSTRFVWAVFAPAWMTLFCALSVWVVLSYGDRAMYPFAFLLSVSGGLIASGIAASRAFVHGEIIAGQATAFTGKRIQCLRAIADEAGLAISLGIVGCNLMRTFLVLIGRQLARLSKLSVPAIAIAYLLMVFATTYALLADASAPVLGWLGAVGGSAGALLLVPAVASLMQGGLGRELVWAGFDCLTTVDSSPDAAPHRLEVLTLASVQDTAEGLRHAVYLHPNCVDCIVDGLLRP